MALIKLSGVSSSNKITASTLSSAASTRARSFSCTTGREGPFSALTERSVFKPSTSLSPRFLAASKYVTWPACSKSKQPLVNTIFWFWFFQIVIFAVNSAKLHILCACTLPCSAFSASIKSALVMGTVPALPTTTPAAKLASCNAASGSKPLIKPAAKVAITVSPAPETSNTCLAVAGRWCVASSMSVIPSSPRVTAKNCKPKLFFNALALAIK